MKLHTAIIMGKFCGLDTVDECVFNAELHYFPCIPYYELDREAAELYQEYKAYMNGTLILDWDEINKQVEKELNDYEASCTAEENKQYNDVIEIDFWKVNQPGAGSAC